MNNPVYTHKILFIPLLLTLILGTTSADGAEPTRENSDSSSLHSEMHDRVGAAAPADGSAPDLEGLTPAQILERAGLSSPQSCLTFGDRESLVQRKNEWREAITALYAADPEFVLSWITGQARPPDVVLREAELQKDCLLTGLVYSSREDSKVRLVLSYEESFAGSVRNAQQLAGQIEANPRRRRQVLQHLTRSAYRDASSQAHIWHRKFHFDGRSFNVVSEEAGARCGIAPGQTWKPASARHGRCWHQELTYAEREREILTASAAPGISRHHWGTDFDILSLNPHSFVERGPLGHDYVWLDANALSFGFFQPFKGPPHPEEHNHMEERWHWSYYPIGQAIIDFMAIHDEEVDEALGAQWDALEARWNRRRRDPIPYFPYVRANWRTYIFGITLPPAPESAENRPAPEH